MPESGGWRCETHLARRRLHQVVSCKGLNKARLPVTAGAVYDTLGGCRGASSNYDVDRSLLARVFARRSSGLYRVGHLCKLLFLLGLRQRANLVFVVLFCGEDVRHERAVENSADGLHIRNLGMVFEPNRMRKSAPG